MQKYLLTTRTVPEEEFQRHNAFNMSYMQDLYGHTHSRTRFPALGVPKFTILVDPSLISFVTYLVCLICLFVWSSSSHSRIFHSYGDVTITGEGLQILTSAWHSWPLSSEVSLACHTYCDMGHKFIMVISEDLDTHT